MKTSTNLRILLSVALAATLAPVTPTKAASVGAKESKQLGSVRNEVAATARARNTVPQYREHRLWLGVGCQLPQQLRLAELASVDPECLRPEAQRHIPAASAGERVPWRIRVLSMAYAEFSTTLKGPRSAEPLGGIRDPTTFERAPASF